MSPTSYQTAPSRDVIKFLELFENLAEKMGFEPMRRSHDLPVFKTGPFSHLGTSPRKQVVDPVGLEPTTRRL